MTERNTTQQPRTCALGPACTTDPAGRLRHGQPIYQAPGGVAHRVCVTAIAGQLAAIRAEVDTYHTGTRRVDALALLDSFAVALTNLRLTATGVLLVDIPSPRPPARDLI